MKKSVAFFLLISFTLLNTSLNLFAETLQAAIPSHGMSHLDVKGILDSLIIPEELGSTYESFIPKNGTNDKLVVYVQDAHANYDSESNTRKLIQFFQDKYQLPLVLLEGGEGKLDSLFFKSFPDQKTKEKILDQYLKQGDLQGGEIASILSDEHDTQYYGIESQALYTENKQAFLEAMNKEKEILTNLDKQAEVLNLKAKEVLTPNASSFRDQNQKFRQEEVGLLEYLKALVSLRGKAEAISGNYPELTKILESEQNEKAFQGADFDIAMNQLIDQFKSQIFPNLLKEQKLETGEMIQNYKIGRLDSGFLVKRIQELSNGSFPIPEVLQPTAKHAETLLSIKGTKLFDELEQLEDELRNTLPQSEEEKKLLQDYKQLELLKSFAKLEITHKDWQALKEQKTSINPMFEIHFKFYELALKRDEALFQNTLNIMGKEKSKLTLITTGGFHQEGIKQKLKDQNIPFILISPKINQIGTKDNYLNAMQDKRSFMKYYKTSLWDALAQDYATKLASTLNEQELTPSMKRWRDRIIQNSIAEGRITQATSYTKYVDALVQALRNQYAQGSPHFNVGDSNAKLRDDLERELDSFLDAYFGRLKSALRQKLDIFSEGLKEIWANQDFSTQAVQNLVNQMNTIPKSNIAIALAMVNDRAGVDGIKGNFIRQATKSVSEQARPDVWKIAEQIAGEIEKNPNLLSQISALDLTKIDPQAADIYAEISKQANQNPELIAQVIAIVQKQFAQKVETKKTIAETAPQATSVEPEPLKSRAELREDFTQDIRNKLIEGLEIYYGKGNVQITPEVIQAVNPPEIIISAIVPQSGARVGPVEADNNLSMMSSLLSQAHPYKIDFNYGMPIAKFDYSPSDGYGKVKVSVRLIFDPSKTRSEMRSNAASAMDSPMIQKLAHSFEGPRVNEKIVDRLKNLNIPIEPRDFHADLISAIQRLTGLTGDEGPVLDEKDAFLVLSVLSGAKPSAELVAPEAMPAEIESSPSFFSTLAPTTETQAQASRFPLFSRDVQNRLQVELMVGTMPSTSGTPTSHLFLYHLPAMLEALIDHHQFLEVHIHDPDLKRRFTEIVRKTEGRNLTDDGLISEIRDDLNRLVTGLLTSDQVDTDTVVGILLGYPQEDVAVFAPGKRHLVSLNLPNVIAQVGQKSESAAQALARFGTHFGSDDLARYVATIVKWKEGLDSFYAAFGIPNPLYNFANRAELRTAHNRSRSITAVTAVLLSLIQNLPGRAEHFFIDSGNQIKMTAPEAVSREGFSGEPGLDQADLEEHISHIKGASVPLAYELMRKYSEQEQKEGRGRPNFLSVNRGTVLDPATGKEKEGLSFTYTLNGKDHLYVIIDVNGNILYHDPNAPLTTQKIAAYEQLNVADKEKLSAAVKDILSHTKGKDPKMIKFLRTGAWKKYFVVTPNLDQNQLHGTGMANQDMISIDEGTLRALLSGDAAARKIGKSTLVHEIFHFLHFRSGEAQKRNPIEEEGITRQETAEFFSDTIYTDSFGRKFGILIVQDAAGVPQFEMKDGVERLRFLIGAYPGEIAQNELNHATIKEIKKLLPRFPSESNIHKKLSREISMLAESQKHSRSEIRTENISPKAFDFLAGEDPEFKNFLDILLADGYVNYRYQLKNTQDPQSIRTWTEAGNLVRIRKKVLADPAKYSEQIKKRLDNAGFQTFLEIMADLTDVSSQDKLALFWRMLVSLDDQDFNRLLGGLMKRDGIEPLTARGIRETLEEFVSKHPTVRARANGDNADKRYVGELKVTRSFIKPTPAKPVQTETPEKSAEDSISDVDINAILNEGADPSSLDVLPDEELDDLEEIPEPVTTSDRPIKDFADEIPEANIEPSAAESVIPELSPQDVVSEEEPVRAEEKEEEVPESKSAPAADLVAPQAAPVQVPTEQVEFSNQTYGNDEKLQIMAEIMKIERQMRQIQDQIDRNLEGGKKWTSVEKELSNQKMELLRQMGDDGLHNRLMELISRDPEFKFGMAVEKEFFDASKTEYRSLWQLMERGKDKGFVDMLTQLILAGAVEFEGSDDDEAGRIENIKRRIRGWFKPEQAQVAEQFAADFYRVARTYLDDLRVQVEKYEASVPEASSTLTNVRSEMRNLDLVLIPVLLKWTDVDNAHTSLKTASDGVEQAVKVIKDQIAAYKDRDKDHLSEMQMIAIRDSIEEGAEERDQAQIELDKAQLAIRKTRFQLRPWLASLKTQLSQAPQQMSEERTVSVQIEYLQGQIRLLDDAAQEIEQLGGYFNDGSGQKISIWDMESEKSLHEAELMVQFKELLIKRTALMREVNENKSGDTSLFDQQISELSKTISSLQAELEGPQGAQKDNRAELRKGSATARLKIWAILTGSLALSVFRNIPGNSALAQAPALQNMPVATMPHISQETQNEIWTRQVRSLSSAVLKWLAENTSFTKDPKFNAMFPGLEEGKIPEAIATLQVEPNPKEWIAGWEGEGKIYLSEQFLKDVTDALNEKFPGENLLEKFSSEEAIRKLFGELLDWRKQGDEVFRKNFLGSRHEALIQCVLSIMNTVFHEYMHTLQDPEGYTGQVGDGVSGIEELEAYRIARIAERYIAMVFGLRWEGEYRDWDPSKGFFKTLGANFNEENASRHAGHARQTLNLIDMFLSKAEKATGEKEKFERNVAAAVMHLMILLNVNKGIFLQLSGEDEFQEIIKKFEQIKNSVNEKQLTLDPNLKKALEVIHSIFLNSSKEVRRSPETIFDRLTKEAHLTSSYFADKFVKPVQPIASQSASKPRSELREEMKTAELLQSFLEASQDYYLSIAQGNVSADETQRLLTAQREYTKHLVLQGEETLDAVMEQATAIKARLDKLSQELPSSEGIQPFDALAFVIFQIAVNHSHQGPLNLSVVEKAKGALAEIWPQQGVHEEADEAHARLDRILRDYEPYEGLMTVVDSLAIAADRSMGERMSIREAGRLESEAANDRKKADALLSVVKEAVAVDHSYIRELSQNEVGEKGEDLEYRDIVLATMTNSRQIALTVRKDSAAPGEVYLNYSPLQLQETDKRMAAVAPLSEIKRNSGYITYYRIVLPSQKIADARSELRIDLSSEDVRDLNHLLGEYPSKISKEEARNIIESLRENVRNGWYRDSKENFDKIDRIIASLDHQLKDLESVQLPESQSNNIRGSGKDYQNVKRHQPRYVGSDLTDKSKPSRGKLRTTPEQNAIAKQTVPFSLARDTKSYNSADHGLSPGVDRYQHHLDPSVRYKSNEWKIYDFVHQLGLPEGAMIYLFIVLSAFVNDYLANYGFRGFGFKGNIRSMKFVPDLENIENSKISIALVDTFHYEYDPRTHPDRVMEVTLGELETIFNLGGLLKAFQGVPENVPFAPALDERSKDVDEDVFQFQMTSRAWKVRFMAVIAALVKQKKLSESMISVRARSLGSPYEIFVHYVDPSGKRLGTLFSLRSNELDLRASPEEKALLVKTEFLRNLYHVFDRLSMLLFWFKEQVDVPNKKWELIDKLGTELSSYRAYMQDLINRVDGSILHARTRLSFSERGEVEKMDRAVLNFLQGGQEFWPGSGVWEGLQRFSVRISKLIQTTPGLQNYTYLYKHLGGQDFYSLPDEMSAFREMVSQVPSMSAPIFNDAAGRALEPTTGQYKLGKHLRAIVARLTRSRAELRTVNQVEIVTQNVKPALTNITATLTDRFLNNAQYSVIDFKDLETLFKSGKPAEEIGKAIAQSVVEQVNKSNQTELNRIHQNQQEVLSRLVSQFGSLTKEEIVALSARDIWFAFIHATNLSEVYMPEGQAFQEWVAQVQKTIRLSVSVTATPEAASLEFANITPQAMAKADQILNVIKNINKPTLLEFRLPSTVTGEGRKALMTELLETARNIAISNSFISIRIVVSSETEARELKRLKDVMANQKDFKAGLIDVNQVSIVTEKSLKFQTNEATIAITPDSMSATQRNIPVFAIDLYANGEKMTYAEGKVTPAKQLIGGFQVDSANSNEWQTPDEHNPNVHRAISEEKFLAMALQIVIKQLAIEAQAKILRARAA